MKTKTQAYTAIKDRKPVLDALRNLKMARSVHAYVRGSTARFYDWLGGHDGLVLPEGPPVWICGDCHVGNLGPLASAKGRIDVQIRDLDQTVIGNPAHDLIRMGLSLASASRGSDLPGVITAKMIEQMVVGYEQAFAPDDDVAITEPQSVERAMEAAMQRKWKDLANERIGDVSPAIPLGRHYWPVSKTEDEALRRLFDDEKMRRMVTSLRSRDDDAAIEVLDAAYWVKGCSSLGNLRYAVLVGIGKGKDRELCLMDVKEAVKAIAPRVPGTDMPKDNAERVVEGAWHVSPALGGRILAGRVLDHSVFVRELLPQDIKFDIDHLTQAEATRVARFLALIVGKAHARQMDEATRKAWQGELSRNRSKTLDAPSWLWSSVVKLVESHEGGYLEHCRKYAMNIG